MPHPIWTELPLPDGTETVRRRVVGAAVRVHAHLGPGFRESIYRKCLAHALRNDGLEVREETWMGVEFEGLRLPSAVRSDIVVEEIVLVELKAVEAFHPIHTSQVVSYLKASGLPLGILLNFNVHTLTKTGYQRIVHPRYLVVADQPGPSGP